MIPPPLLPVLPSRWLLCPLVRRLCVCGRLLDEDGPAVGDSGMRYGFCRVPLPSSEGQPPRGVCGECGALPGHAPGGVLVHCEPPSPALPAPAAPSAPVLGDVFPPPLSRLPSPAPPKKPLPHGGCICRGICPGVLGLLPSPSLGIIPLRHWGHVSCSLNQAPTHSPWNQCLHGNSVTSSPTVRLSIHIEHSALP